MYQQRNICLHLGYHVQCWIYLAKVFSSVLISFALIFTSMHIWDGTLKLVKALRNLHVYKRNKGVCLLSGFSCAVSLVRISVNTCTSAPCECVIKIIKHRHNSAWINFNNAMYVEYIEYAVKMAPVEVVLCVKQITYALYVKVLPMSTFF